MQELLVKKTLFFSPAEKARKMSNYCALQAFESTILNLEYRLTIELKLGDRLSNIIQSKMATCFTELF